MVNGAVTFLQKDNVADNIRASIGAKRIVRQTDDTQQISTFSNVLAGRRILAVQRVAAGNKGHDAARTHLVDGFCKEIIVDRKSQLVVRLVVDFIIAKWHIAHGKVIEIAAVSGFKSGNFYASFRVELLRNATCNAVQFYTVQAAVCHAVRQQAKKITNAHGGFQYIAAAEAHALRSIIDGTNHHRGRIVCVQGAGTGGCIFFFGEQPFQFGVFLCPAIFFIIKNICKTAPAYILRKHLLLLGGGTAMLLLQSAQGLDGFNIAGEFLLGASDTQIIIRDVKISCGFRHRFSVQGFVCGSSIRKGLPLAIDLHRDRQLVQFLIRCRFIPPQTVLELLLVEYLVIPRLPMRAGVDANIHFAYIADFAFDGSGGKVNNNFVTDLVINSLFRRNVNNFILLLFIQFPDIGQPFNPEDGLSAVGQVHVLQADGFEHEVDVIHTEIPAI